MTRHLFILNPVAGTKDRTKKLQIVIEKLGVSDDYDIFVTDSKGSGEREVERYLNEHGDDFVRIYSCGGDGTLAEVANGVYRSGSENCAIAIVPVGSGNDFIKSLGIPAEKFHSLRGLLDGEIIDVDLLLATDEDKNERVSLNIISAGFDAAVAKDQENFKKLPLVSGGMAYNVSLLKCFFTNTKNYFSLFIDGVPCESNGSPCLFAIAANGRYYGGGYKASPYSEISDGTLEFIRIKTVPKLKMLTLIGKFRAGRHIDEFGEICTYTPCKSMQFVSEKPIDVNLDGDIYPMKNPTIEILHKRMKLILPRK